MTRFAAAHWGKTRFLAQRYDVVHAFAALIIARQERMNPEDKCKSALHLAQSLSTTETLGQLNDYLVATRPIAEFMEKVSDSNLEVAHKVLNWVTTVVMELRSNDHGDIATAFAKVTIDNNQQRCRVANALPRT
eukprot:PhM_4_TR10059/c4_g1_i1/m.42540